MLKPSSLAGRRARAGDVAEGVVAVDGESLGRRMSFAAPRLATSTDQTRPETRSGNRWAPVASIALVRLSPVAVSTRC